jgi:mono/diheme cytochrome c family protein
MAKVRTGAAYPSIGNEARTASLVIGRYCASCHMIEGEGGMAGPDLTHEGTKHDAKWLKEWISDPSVVDAGANMPPFGDRLSADELTQLSNYLANRK